MKASGARYGIGLVWLALLAMLLTGCATTTIRSAWFAPAYTGPPFHKLVVVGIDGTVADRRVFEDVFTARLRALGVDAVPSYQLIADDAKADEPRWNAAVQASGADALVMVRLVRVDTRTQVSTMMRPGPWFAPWGAYGWYPGWVAYPEVTQYDVATVETNLFDVRDRRVVWAATSETIDPRSVARATEGFADVIIGELARRNLIRAATAPR